MGTGPSTRSTPGMDFCLSCLYAHPDSTGSWYGELYPFSVLRISSLDYVSGCGLPILHITAGFFQSHYKDRFSLGNDSHFRVVFFSGIPCDDSHAGDSLCSDLGRWRSATGIPDSGLCVFPFSLLCRCQLDCFILAGLSQRYRSGSTSGFEPVVLGNSDLHECAAGSGTVPRIHLCKSIELLCVRLPKLSAGNTATISRNHDVCHVCLRGHIYGGWAAVPSVEAWICRCSLNFFRSIDSLFGTVGPVEDESSRIQLPAV